MTRIEHTLPAGNMLARNDLSRLTATVLPAAAMTGLLYLAMNALISVQEVVLEEASQRELIAITPQRQDDPAKPVRPKITQIEAAVKPPPPPRPTASQADIDLPIATFRGAAPKEIVFENPNTFVVDPVTTIDRNATPLFPPSPSYPRVAATRGIEGNCEVTFDVDTRGRPFNVVAACTDNVFQREAVRAVSKVEFAPKVVRGQQVERRNVVYPLQFRLPEEQ